MPSQGGLPLRAGEHVLGTHRSSRRLIEPSSGGMVPVSVLYDKSMWSRFVRLPRNAGRVPSSLLVYKLLRGE